MAIQDILNKLSSELFMKDMRQHIVDGLEQVYKDATAKGNTNMEVLRARGSSPTLNDRLDVSENQLANTENQLAQTEKALQGIDRTFSDETFGTLSELQAKYPIGNDERHVVSTDGKWYWWNGSGWVPGQVAQAIGIADNSVEPKQTTFLVESTNLYDESKNMNGKVISSSTGLIVDNADYRTNNEFIKVTPGSEITLSGITLIQRYNSNKLHIGTYNVPDADIKKCILTISVDTYFIKVSQYRGSWVLNMQINMGNTLLTYEPFHTSIESLRINGSQIDGLSVDSNQADFIKPSSNLYDKKRELSGYTLSSVGVLTVNSAYKTIPDIEISANESYVLKGLGRVMFFDSNKNFIVGSYKDISDNTILTVIAPINSVYMGVSYHTANPTTLKQINKGTELQIYEPLYKFLDGVEVKKIKPYFFAPEDISGNYVSKKTDYINLTTLSSVYEAYDRLIALYPNYVSKTFLGNDSSGVYPIYQYRLKPNQLTTAKLDKVLPKILLSACIHGEEKPSALMLFYMVKAICEDWKTSPLLEYLRWNVEFIFIPVLNAYSFETGTVRHNVNGVDLARNLSERWTASTPGTQTYGGTAPFSEVESMYLKGMIDSNRDAIYFGDLHAAGSGDVYGELIYHVVPIGDYYDENIEIAAKYNVEQTTRELIKNYNLPESEGYFGWLDRSNIGGGTATYARAKGLPATVTESFYRLPNEAENYSVNTLKAGSEFMTNWILTIIKQFKKN